MAYRLRIDGSSEHARVRREELRIPRDVAEELGRSTVDAIRTGGYAHESSE